MINFSTIVIWILYLISLYIIIFWLLVLIEGKKTNKIKKLKKFPLVSILIPAYNEQDTIIGVLKSVIKLDYPKNKLEIIVVNDGSTDNTANLVKRFINENKNYNINLINQKNSGKGTALNKGLNVCKGEFFTCLDADSFIKEDALKKMLPHFQDEKVGVVLPLMKITQPKNVLQKIQWVEYLINLFYKSIMSHLNCVHVAPGPFSVYRTKLLRSLGGFDEKNLTEDLEISLRLQSKNYKILQLMNTEVYTVAPDNLKGFYKQRNRWYKGTLLNTLKYKNLVGNKKYGDFGIIQMPRVAISGFFAITALGFITYNYVLNPIIKRIYDFSFINFNFLSHLQEFIKNFNLL
ncbi:MAG: glycosyltransferase family 2 protein, partial [Nanoarchaeota archaeon]